MSKPLTHPVITPAMGRHIKQRIQTNNKVQEALQNGYLLDLAEPGEKYVDVEIPGVNFSKPVISSCPICSKAYIASADGLSFNRYCPKHTKEEIEWFKTLEDQT